MIDYCRWDEVESLKELQKRAGASVKALSGFAQATGALKIRIADEVERARWVGNTISRLFECASRTLERTEAFGSPESIKRSYRQVVRNLADPKRAHRYFLLSPSVLRLLGITSDLGLSKSKVLPWRSGT